jgi:5-methylcytosine-specific restriction endonuclease McrA
MTVKLKPKDYKVLKRKVFLRDGWACRFCEDRNNLHAHHVVYRSQLGEDTMENMITLCYKHHKLAHKKKLKIVPLEDDLRLVVNTNKPVKFILQKDKRKILQ